MHTLTTITMMTTMLLLASSDRAAADGCRPGDLRGSWTLIANGAFGDEADNFPIRLQCHLEIDRNGDLRPGTMCGGGAGGFDHNAFQDEVSSGRNFLLTQACLIELIPGEQLAVFALAGEGSDPDDPDSFLICEPTGAVNRSLDVVAGRMSCSTGGQFAGLTYTMLKRRGGRDHR